MPLQFIRDDITRVEADAIVNAANSSLLGGGGVDGAIHRAAGPELLEECRTLGGCATGEAKITKGYRLPAKYVIHTVGPIYRNGKHGEEELLRSCYRNSLELAAQYGLHSVAFPLISAGVYGYPKDEAIAVAIDEIRRFLFTDDTDMEVTLVFFDKKVSLLSKKLFGELKERIDDAYAEAHYNENLRERRRMQLKGLFRKDREQAKEFAPWEGEAQLYAPEADDSLEPLEEKLDYCESMPMLPEDKPAPNAHKKDGSISPDFAQVPPSAPNAKVRPQQATGAAPIYGKPAAGAAMSFSAQELKKQLEVLDEGFTGMLLRKIDERGMTDAECYKKANIDRKLFSKIRSNPAYRPKKTTVFAFSIALKLSLQETEALLKKAGYAFSDSSKSDIIVRYYIEHGRYDIYDINEALYEFDQALLGA